MKHLKLFCIFLRSGEEILPRRGPGEAARPAFDLLRAGRDAAPDDGGGPGDLAGGDGGAEATVIACGADGPADRGR